MPTPRHPSRAAFALVFALTGCSGPVAEAPKDAPRAVASLGEVAVEIFKGAPLLERVRVGLYGVAFGPPNGAVERVLFVDDGVREELKGLVAAYAPFEVAIGAARFRFRGRGALPAPPPEQRRIAEWVQFVVGASTGMAGEAPSPVLSWQRGGDGEECEGLLIDRVGAVRGGPCAEGGGVPRRLAGPELAQLYAWFDALAPFQVSWLEGLPGEERTLRLVFGGAGKRQPSAAERGGIAAFSTALAADLAIASSPKFSPPVGPVRREVAPIASPLRPPLPPRPAAPLDLAPKTAPKTTPSS